MTKFHVFREVSAAGCERNARIEGVTTTAIGALHNGALGTTVDLSTTVNGQKGDVTAATAALARRG